MYRILIAEPYEKERTRVKECIKENITDMSVAGDAASVQEAVQLMKEESPQIILLSGEMVERSGLELSMVIREYCPDAAVIVMTPKDSMEQKTKDIHMQVDKFLLMPIQDKLLADSLKDTATRLRRKERARFLGRELDSPLGKAAVFAEFDLMNNLLMRNLDKAEFTQYKSILPIIPEGMAMVCKLSCIYEKGGKKKLPDRISLYRSIREEILPWFNSYIYINQVDEIICFLETTAAEGEEEIMQLGEKLSRMFQYRFAVKCQVGFGRPEQMEYLYESYYDALKNLSQGHMSGIVPSEEQVKNPKDSSLLDLECGIFESLRMGQNDASVYFREYLQQLKNEPLNVRKDRIMEVLVVSCFISRVDLSGKQLYISYENYLEILEYESWEFIRKWSETVFRNILRLVRVRYGDNRTGVIYQAQDYIMDHYNHEISMEEVAKLFGVTPQYFSKLFKEKAGMNYVDWVLKLRIQKAKELIRYTNISMQDVSAKVGFSDSNYFSRAFKQQEGQSPTAYLKKCRIGEAEENLSEDQLINL